METRKGASKNEFSAKVKRLLSVAERKQYEGGGDKGRREGKEGGRERGTENEKEIEREKQR